MHTITIEYINVNMFGMGSRYAWCICEYMNGRMVKMCCEVSGFYTGIAPARSYASLYGARFVA